MALWHQTIYFATFHLLDVWKKINLNAVSSCRPPCMRYVLWLIRGRGGMWSWSCHWSIGDCWQRGLRAAAETAAATHCHTHLQTDINDTYCTRSLCNCTTAFIHTGWRGKSGTDPLSTTTLTGWRCGIVVSALAELVAWTKLTHVRPG